MSHNSTQAMQSHDRTANTQRKPGRALTPKLVTTQATVSTMRCSDPLWHTAVGTGARPVRSTKRRMRNTSWRTGSFACIKACAFWISAEGGVVLRSPPRHTTAFKSAASRSRRRKRSMRSDDARDCPCKSNFETIATYVTASTSSSRSECSSTSDLETTATILNRWARTWPPMDSFCCTRSVLCERRSKRKRRTSVPGNGQPRMAR